MIDIINTYAKAGYDCVLLTGRLVVRNNPLNESVKIDRIIRYKRTTTFNRLLTWGIGTIQILIKILIKYKKYQLFVISNPPFTTLIPLVVKNPYQLLIFDVYPDAIAELGYLSDKSIIIKWWRKSNRKVFSKANRVFTITDSMKKVLQKYADKQVIEVVPIWTDNTFLMPVDPTDNPFLKTLNLSGKFIVMYSGNIGLSGGVDVLVDLAARISNNDIYFLIIGDGTNKGKLMEKAKRLSLKNLVFLPWQPVNQLSFSLSSASLAFIFLGQKTSKLVIPSKLFNFLSVGVPLLCVSPFGSEVERLVLKYECGRNFSPEDNDGIVHFINEAATNKELLMLMKSNSLKASLDFGPSNLEWFLAATHHE